MSITKATAVAFRRLEVQSAGLRRLVAVHHETKVMIGFRESDYPVRFWLVATTELSLKFRLQTRRDERLAGRAKSCLRGLCGSLAPG